MRQPYEIFNEAVAAQEARAREASHPKPSEAPAVSAGASGAEQQAWKPGANLDRRAFEIINEAIAAQEARAQGARPSPVVVLTVPQSQRALASEPTPDRWAGVANPRYMGPPADALWDAKDKELTGSNDSPSSALEAVSTVGGCHEGPAGAAPLDEAVALLERHHHVPRERARAIVLQVAVHLLTRPP